MIEIERYHDISCGHRVVDHESKCRRLHGHNYRIHFRVAAESLDPLGRVVDFSVIKETLCAWLEKEWDHKYLLWERDPLLPALRDLSPESVAVVPFNPTAENMALHLLNVVGPKLLAPYRGCTLIACRVDETRKCSATASLS